MLRDKALDVGLLQPELARLLGSIAAKLRPPPFLEIPSKRFTEELALGSPFLLCQTLGFPKQGWGSERERILLVLMATSFIILVITHDTSWWVVRQAGGYG